VLCDPVLNKSLLAIALLFSGEENYGKYLDLYANHTAYNNLKNIGKRPGYLQYLDLLLAAQNAPVHSDLPKETRFTKDFEACVNYFKIAPPFNSPWNV
jgi:splicing factor 3A subunit 3